MGLFHGLVFHTSLINIIAPLPLGQSCPRQIAMPMSTVGKRISVLRFMSHETTIQDISTQEGLSLFAHT